jgi:predicted metal-dependent phosphoesterase TrpH/glycosyltransferase involved in cell wall biosynthesis
VRAVRHPGKDGGELRPRTAALHSAGVSLRICLVTPFSWSQPHDVNEHVAGAAQALRQRDHEVTIIAPSGRRQDLLAGRRALESGTLGDLVTICPAVPVSRRSVVGIASRANLRLALQQGAFDVVHGFEPGFPSISQLALTEASALTVATFTSPDRLAFPSTRAQRDRFRARVDALLATSRAAAEAAAERFPGELRLVPAGFDPRRFTPAPKRHLIVLHAEAGSRPLARALVRLLDQLPEWELILLHRTPLTVRPTIPGRLRDRVHVRAGRRPEARASILGAAEIFVPALEETERLQLEASAAGCAIVGHAPGEEPDEVAARVLALAGDAAEIGRARAEALASTREQTFDHLGAVLETVYGTLAPKRRPRRGLDPFAERDWITVDLHMHTSWSHDCSIDPDELVAHAETVGLGAIAVTDHNVFGGALEAVAAAAGKSLIVIPGEEVKTDNQGEVIGLFLESEIPRGMSFADTVAAIREQGGVVYLPHPFDRMHAIPDPATLHRHLADIDVLEVYNARLLRDSFNDEALRFARKYRLLQGAGSDAHVLQGIGTGALRMRRFDGPEEFLLSLRTAEVLRRPKSLAYLQSLKWVAQLKDRIASPAG